MEEPKLESPYKCLKGMKVFCLHIENIDTDLRVDLINQRKLKKKKRS